MSTFEKQEDIELRFCPDCKEQKVVKMVYAYLSEEDGKIPEIWTCQNCNKKYGRIN